MFPLLARSGFVARHLPAPGFRLAPGPLGEAPSLLPGHPKLSSQRSLARISGMPPGTQVIPPPRSPCPGVPSRSVYLDPALEETARNAMTSAK
jgi:hypothetical protein